MAGNAFRRGTQSWFGVWTVAFYTALLYRKQNVGTLTAAARQLVTRFALHSFHRHMFGVVEIRRQHPAIDQNWFGDGRRAHRCRGYLVTVSAPGKISCLWAIHAGPNLVGIGFEKYPVNELFIRGVLRAQSFALIFD